MAPSTSTLLTLGGNMRAEVGEKISYFSQTETGLALLHSSFGDLQMLEPLHTAMRA